MDHQHNGLGDQPGHLFDNFVKAGTCKSILSTFHQLCDVLELKHANHHHFYRRLSSRLTSWKAQSLWAKLNKRYSQKEYRKAEGCANTRVLVIGCGPCGLRTAIEAAFLGCKVVLLEKRDSFSRNNVLHLWPYLITDLRNLGAKKFFGKFCAGAIDHISIRQLQCILMKVALILGVEIHLNVAFEGLVEPVEDEDHKVGWRCLSDPSEHVVSEYEFDVLIGADGKRNTLHGFKRKEFRGKLAIAITANFINRNTQEEARVEEISGVAFIFNQKFFKDLNRETGIDLENIVYYKDDTHYFVMTAKKNSLLDKGVLKNDYTDTAKLLSPANVNRDALLEYAKEAADFSTNNQLPQLEYAINHYGQPDVAMFDFTSMFAALNASRVIDRNGHQLLMGLVGDSLLEPFWPTGSGCARGFLGAFDAAWMIRSWSLGRMTPLQVIAERESIYQLLSQTTPENLNKNYNEYTIDPNTRYPNMNTKLLKTEQVRHLYDCGNEAYKDEILNIPAKRARNEESAIDSYTLLHWCQRVLNYKFRHVHVVDLTSSWRSGLALCALIQTFKPGLIEFNALSSLEIAQNNQLAFDVAQKDLGISPVMTGAEMASCATPDKLTMVSYLSQFYHKFRRERNPSVESPHHLREERGPKSPLHKSLLQKIRNSARFSRSKKKKDEERNEHNTSLSKRKYNDDENQMNGNVKLTKYNKLPMDEIANKLTVDQTRKDDVKQNDVLSKVKVSAMAEILVSKFKSHNTTEPSAAKTKAKNPGILLAAQPESEICYFCQKRVYIMERMNAENVFFHRGCLKCDFCYTGLRVTNYSCERSETGQVKFYCFRHSRPELRKVRTRRKRMFVDDETAKENIPKVIIDGTESPKLSQRKDFQESPKKIPTPLSPPLQPETDYVKAKKTPERIEFENSIDGLQEESEEELTEHNLRASLSYDAGKNIDDEFSDSDLESSDDEELQEAVESTYGHAVNKDLTLEEALFVVETLKRKSHENLIEAVENEGKYEQEGEEDESDSEEESGSEGDAESETEDMDVAETSSPERPHPKLFINIDSPQSHVQTAQKHARANFFTTPPEPVRLDPWKMFGMGKKEEETQQIESPSHEAVPEDAEINGENVKEDVDKMDDRREESEEEIKNDEMAEFDEKENDEEDEEMDIKKYEQTESSVNESDMEENEDEKEQVNEEVEQAEVYVEVKQAEAYEEVEQVVANEEDEQAEVDEVVEQAEEEEEEEIKDEECDDVFDDVEDEDDKQALEKQMEMILADIDHKSSISDAADLKSSISDGSNARSSSVSDADQSANEDDEVFPSADDATEKAVLASVENMNSSASRSSQSIREEVLNSVRAMEEPEEEQNVDQARISIDDRFVTQGRGRSTKKKRQKQKFRKSFESDSSFTISTPSGSPHTSISSLVDEQMLDEGEGPDHDMLEDYCLTLSQYLGESYGDENVPQESDDTPRPSELSPRVESIGVSPHDLDDTLLEEEEVVNDVNNSNSGSTNVNVGGRDSSAYVTPNESVSINERFFSMSDSENLNGSTSSRTSVSAIDNIDEKTNHVCDSHVKSDANLLTSDKNKTVVLNSSVSKDKLSKSSELKTDTTLVSPSDNKLLNSDGSTWRPLPPIPGTASGKTTEPLKITGENKKVSSISSKATVVPKQKSVEKSEVSSRKLPDISKLKSSVNTQGFQSNFMRKHLGSPTGTDGSSSSKEGSSSPEFKYSSRNLTSNSTISSSEDDQNKNKKTKVSVDHAKLKSFNSIDDSSSQGENLVGRKKIGVDTQLRERVKAEPVKSRVSVEHHIEDIPFADDSGDDLDDKFFTPATSVKNPPPKKEVVKTDVRKRILPMPPKMEDTPSMPSVEHIREVKKAEMESAREKARQKARLKSDEELGLTNMNYTPKMAGNLRKRNTDRTPSTSDFITDSDDAGKFLHSTPIDKTDLDKTPTKSAKSKKKKKDKDLTPHGSDKSDNEITSKVPYKKKKSLLQILKPNRSPEKSPKDMKDKRSSSNDTLDEKMPAKKKKTPKSDKKKKKKHASESALEHLDRDLSNLNLHGVTPRFLGEKGEKISSRRHPALRKPVAPRAELDEFSDSDESRVSIDTLSRKPRDRRIMSEDELNVRIARRVQSAARKQQKQREQKRLRMAQEIQRQLEEVDVKQKELEERGVVVEKALRGEGPDASRDESELMQEWFTLVYEKNALVRYESELMVNAQYMELEDRHGRLEQELREKMAASNGEKTAQHTVEEKRVLDELLEVVEERDKLVAMLEDDRVREREEDRDLEAIMNAKGFNLNPTDYAHNIKYKAQIFPLSC